MSKIKRIDIKEFREKGYLQELNRQFLHPLGLALEVIVDDDSGFEHIGGVWDYRHDPEGMRYANMDVKEATVKAINIGNEMFEKKKCRLKNLKICHTTNT